MKLKDTSILLRLKENEQEGYKELFDFYYRPLVAYAVNYCDSISLAEDIVQELFVSMWDKKHYLTFQEQIGPYLYRSVKNNAFKILQRNKTVYIDQLGENIKHLYDEEYIDEKNLEARKKKLYDELESLPEKRKEVFVAIVFEDRSYKDVAASMDISVNTVKTHYARALKQLRNSVDNIILFLMLKGYK